MAKKQTNIPETSPALAAAAAAAVREEKAHLLAKPSAVKKAVKTTAPTSANPAKAVSVEKAVVVEKAAAAIPQKAAALAAPVANKAEAPQIVNGVSTSIAEPARAEVALLAFLYWEDRGYQGGSETEDWLRAEAELKNRMVRSAGA